MQRGEMLQFAPFADAHAQELAASHALCMRRKTFATSIQSNSSRCQAVHEVELCLACVEGVCCGIQERHEVGKELVRVYLLCFGIACISPRRNSECNMLRVPVRAMINGGKTSAPGKGVPPDRRYGSRSPLVPIVFRVPRETCCRIVSSCKNKL